MRSKIKALIFASKANTRKEKGVKKMTTNFEKSTVSCAFIGKLKNFQFDDISVNCPLHIYSNHVKNLLKDLIKGVNITLLITGEDLCRSNLLYSAHNPLEYLVPLIAQDIYEIMGNAGEGFYAVHCAYYGFTYTHILDLLTPSPRLTNAYKIQYIRTAEDIVQYYVQGNKKHERIGLEFGKFHKVWTIAVENMKNNIVTKGQLNIIELSPKIPTADVYKINYTVTHFERLCQTSLSGKMVMPTKDKDNISSKIINEAIYGNNVTIIINCIDDDFSYDENMYSILRGTSSCRCITKEIKVSFEEHSVLRALKEKIQQLNSKLTEKTMNRRYKAYSQALKSQALHEDIPCQHIRHCVNTVIKNAFILKDPENHIKNSIQHMKIAVKWLEEYEKIKHSKTFTELSIAEKEIIQQINDLTEDIFMPTENKNPAARFTEEIDVLTVNEAGDEEQQENSEPACATNHVASGSKQKDPENIQIENSLQDKSESSQSEENQKEPYCVWKEVFDDSTGYNYYWNVKSNDVTWECPVEYTIYLQKIQYLCGDVPPKSDSIEIHKKSKEKKEPPHPLEGLSQREYENKIKSLELSQREYENKIKSLELSQWEYENKIKSLELSQWEYENKIKSLEMNQNIMMLELNKVKISQQVSNREREKLEKDQNIMIVELNKLKDLIEKEKNEEDINEDNITDMEFFNREFENVKKTGKNLEERFEELRKADDIFEGELKSIRETEFSLTAFRDRRYRKK